MVAASVRCRESNEMDSDTRRHFATATCRTSRSICIGQITRDQEAAVRIQTHPSQYACSSRSSRTRFGKTRFPKIRLARASTSGHLTGRFFLGLRGSSLSAKIANKNFSLSRAGIAFTSLINSVALTWKYTRCFCCRQQGRLTKNELPCKH